LRVFNDRPLLTQTIERIRGYFKNDEIVLVIPEELRKITREFTGRMPMIVEPMRRNTAPAIGLAAMTLQRKFGDGLMHVMPADHIISTRGQFVAALRSGERMAQAGYLVTYGIRPDRAETGYGYVKVGGKIKMERGIAAFEGEGFTEKPSATRARHYLNDGRYLWNSGIFTFRISTILREMADHIPAACRSLGKYVKTHRPEYFARIKGTSIDCGVMEKSRRLCVIKAPFSWDDVGSWLALERYFKKNAKGNIFIGDTLGLETYGSIVYTYNIPVKLFGVSGLVIVACPRGILVCRKDRIPEMKKLLRKKGG
jgi:mannose-1-phosphate guanylyltransferase